MSIIKRSEALGLLAHSDSEERFTRTRSECEALLRIAMGGMVAEELFFGEASTGPSGDLAGATRLAAQMVGSYGMAGSLISLEASSGPADIVSKVLSDESCRQSVETLLEIGPLQRPGRCWPHISTSWWPSATPCWSETSWWDDEITRVVTAALRAEPAEPAERSELVGPPKFAGPWGRRSISSPEV